MVHALDASRSSWLLCPVAAAIPAVCVALAWLVLAELPQPATAAASKATVVVASAGRCQ